jgi:hypothetical protein
MTIQNNTIQCHAIRPGTIVRAAFETQSVEVQNALIRGLLPFDLNTANVLRMWQIEQVQATGRSFRPTFDGSLRMEPQVSIDHNVEMPVKPRWIHPKDEVL